MFHKLSSFAKRPGGGIRLKCTVSSNSKPNIFEDLPFSRSYAVRPSFPTRYAELFAHLEFSDARSYDPAALTSALSLDVAVQQDAQEFNKLLL